ncbi:GNAT family N-acetyltransferase [Tranquillimonas rosea]|uniref:GNAT family N-acetyltransferase n=1 Tax=Tranquillimonas rosea TaxID=641238 RepID=UPI003BAABE86
MSVRLDDFSDPDAAWVIARHAELYRAECGFDHRFEAAVRGVVARFIEARCPAREAAWIAWQGGVRLGSLFCTATDRRDTARLRLFLLEPEARGQGLGWRMLETCRRFARETSHTRLILSTHESHRAACALYAASGFRMTAARPVRSFGRDLVEQEWEIAL